MKHTVLSTSKRRFMGCARHSNCMKKNDRRNNGIGLLTKIWYYAEAWLELNRLAAHDRW
jgi:hypothetical protein